MDVTLIIHWGPASDVESYMQEFGRAGRNGQQSSAVLCEEFRSEKKKKAYCALILTLMSLMSRFVLSLVCVLIVSVIVSPSA